MDPVNPPWYDANGIKLVDVQEAFVPDKPHRWPAFKYLARAGKKPGQDEIQDLRKAIWWIEREIQQIEEARSMQPTPAVLQGAELLRNLAAQKTYTEASIKDFSTDCQSEWRRGGVRLSNPASSNPYVTEMQNLTSAYERYILACPLDMKPLTFEQFVQQLPASSEDPT